jgi:hypothetical protein
MSQVLCSTIVPEFLQVLKIKLRDSIVWHSQVSQYMWHLWILTKAIKMLCLLLPTSMWGFIGRKKARAYLQCIYYKVKQWIQRELSHTIKSRYACVWNIWWICMMANPNSTLLLKNISPF